VSQAKELKDLEFVYAGYKTYQISIKQLVKATDLDFSEMVDFDEFSQRESVSATEMIEELDDLSRMRIKLA
jgi:endonuclease G, mitochondrial